jgi:threonine synthase
LEEKPHTGTSFICISCGLRIQADRKSWRCDTCGGLLDIEMHPQFPLEKITTRPFTMWRYREALPIELDENIISLGEPVTPIVKINLSGKSLMIKLEHLFPTGSLKDRGASVLVSKMRELGIEKAVEDSSGNAGASIAAYCKAAGIACEIFVPSHVSPAKAFQIEIYGAYLRLIEGSRENVAEAALFAAGELYYASHCRNPFFLHGVKTFAYEIAEQLGWNAPDTLILPVGNGTLLLGAFIGFKELFQAGLIKKIPKIVGVQAANCAPLYKDFTTNSSVKEKNTFMTSIAEGIAIAEPVRRGEILRCVKESSGLFLTVTEKEICTALRHMLEKGYMIEPTAAAAIAGAEKYLASSETGEQVVSVITGHGLKAPDKIRAVMKDSMKTDDTK